MKQAMPSAALVSLGIFYLVFYLNWNCNKDKNLILSEF